MHEIILSIDPGYDRMGCAVIGRRAHGKHALLFSTCITTKKEDTFPARLFKALEEVDAAIKAYAPSALALENLFLTNNQKTAMRVAEVRGALIYLAAKHNLELFEYTPLEIKLAVTGYGKSSKDEVAAMLKHLVDLPDGRRLDDEYDAVAIGLAHIAIAKSPYPHAA